MSRPRHSQIGESHVTTTAQYAETTYNAKFSCIRESCRDTEFSTMGVANSPDHVGMSLPNVGLEANRPLDRSRQRANVALGGGLRQAMSIVV
jgi:hypothetical protein